MRNAKIFSFVRISERSMVASVRIARWLHEHLDVPLVDDDSIQEGKLDTLIIVNGAYGFSKNLAALGSAIERARVVVWVQNDYTIIPPRDEGDASSPFRRAFVLRKEQDKLPTIFWSTCEKWFSRPGSHRVNWNMLTFDVKFDLRIIAKRRKSSTNTLFYYGSWRDGSGKSSRVPLFERYFRNPYGAELHQTVISSPVEKFRNAYPKCTHVGAITNNFYDVVGGHGLGLYIEDRKSSEEFHSPANRFYEMLSAGLPMVFQPEAGPALRREGHDPTPYVASNARQIEKFMKNREDIGKRQREDWVAPYQRRLIDQVTVARRALP